MVRDTPEFMKPVDRRILELLEQTKSAKVGGLWMKGATIATNLNNSTDYINRRLRELKENDYVETRERPKGYYRITKKGSSFVRSN